MDLDLYKSLVASIDNTYVLERLQEMIVIRSENPFDSEPRAGYREAEMGQYYGEMMTANGLEVQFREIKNGRSNVFGFRKGQGGGITLMLAGHLDTAPTEDYADAYKVKHENGKVYGRGACDMKAALAAYLEVVRILNAARLKLKGNLIIGGIIDEEYKMIGSKDVGLNGPHADQGIIGEPSGLLVCPANRGQLGTHIRTFGMSVHSSVPETGENAIVHMSKAIQAFSDYNEALLQAEPHPLCGHGRFTPSVIKGGTILSTVPDQCELEVDRRVLPGETKDKVFEEYRSRLDPLIKDNPTFRYEITEPTWDIPANDISEQEPVVQSLLSAFQVVMGKPTQCKAFAAATDAPNMGFPTVVCGPGSIDQAHGKNEFVSVEQVVQAVRMYLWSILDLLL
jgi:acetylornithine deacetylase